MPSPFGHLVAGLTVAVAADAGRRPDPPWPILAVACAVLAAAPDLDLLIPGFHRTATHSLFAVGVVLVATLALTGRAGRPNWRVALLCAFAYATHLVTDYFGVDDGTPAGIQLLWPWGTGYYKSAWSLFLTTERDDPLSMLAMRVNAMAFVRESVVLLPLLGLAWLRRRRRGSASSTTPSRRP